MHEGHCLLNLESRLLNAWGTYELLQVHVNTNVTSARCVHSLPRGQSGTGKFLPAMTVRRRAVRRRNGGWYRKSGLTAVGRLPGGELKLRRTAAKGCWERLS